MSNKQGDEQFSDVSENLYMQHILNNVLTNFSVWNAALKRQKGKNMVFATSMMRMYDFINKIYYNLFEFLVLWNIYLAKAQQSTEYSM